MLLEFQGCLVARNVSFATAIKAPLCVLLRLTDLLVSYNRRVLLANSHF